MVDNVGAVEGVKIQDEPRGRILYMGLNQKDPVLSNPQVIEAMKYLVDYDGIANSFLKGTFVPHQSFLPKGYLGALEDMPWTYDVAKAKALIG